MAKPKTGLVLPSHPLSVETQYVSAGNSLFRACAINIMNIISSFAWFSQFTLLGAERTEDTTGRAQSSGMTGT